ncbi:hypothetical protein CDAR_189871 [Caerostris darwini]|uniref:Uncharacterized protein n=1 Tax=Caerostris darwini TaxID=1538125 RepID=A0AAV4V2F4_9ARAC|nr:hypothetical protein CDAR_189871 [Caerostris darwini]
MKILCLFRKDVELWHQIILQLRNIGCLMPCHENHPCTTSRTSAPTNQIQPPQPCPFSDLRKHYDRKEIIMLIMSFTHQYPLPKTLAHILMARCAV